MKILLLDFSNIAHSTFHQIIIDKTISKNPDPFTPERVQYWKYMMLNSIKKILKIHKPNELIICCDTPSWRRKAFPYYKANRDEIKKNAFFDYKDFFNVIDDFVKEVSEYFPYKIIKINMAEADDIMACLAYELKKENEILIISNDKDLCQLIDTNVKVWSLSKKEYRDILNPNQFLLEHILMGDIGDGIPSVINPDDAYIRDSYVFSSLFKAWLKKNNIKLEFVTREDEEKYQAETQKSAKIKERCKPCGIMKINKMLEYGLEKYLEENDLKRNYNRNKKLIQLDNTTIPQKLWDFIKRKYLLIPNKKYDMIKVLQYLRANKFKTLETDFEGFRLNTTISPLHYKMDISEIF